MKDGYENFKKSLVPNDDGAYTLNILSYGTKMHRRLEKSYFTDLYDGLENVVALDGVGIFHRFKDKDKGIYQPTPGTFDPTDFDRKKVSKLHYPRKGSRSYLLEKKGELIGAGMDNNIEYVTNLVQRLINDGFNITTINLGGYSRGGGQSLKLMHEIEEKFGNIKMNFCLKEPMKGRLDNKKYDAFKKKTLPKNVRSGMILYSEEPRDVKFAKVIGLEKIKASKNTLISSLVVWGYHGDLDIKPRNRKKLKKSSAYVVHKITKDFFLSHGATLKKIEENEGNEDKKPIKKINFIKDEVFRLDLNNQEFHCQHGPARAKEVHKFITEDQLNDSNLSEQEKNFHRNIRKNFFSDNSVYPDLESNIFKLSNEFVRLKKYAETLNQELSKAYKDSSRKAHYSEMRKVDERSNLVTNSLKLLNGSPKALKKCAIRLKKINKHISDLGCQIKTSEVYFYLHFFHAILQKAASNDLIKEMSYKTVRAILKTQKTLSRSLEEIEKTETAKLSKDKKYLLEISDLKNALNQHRDYVINHESLRDKIINCKKVDRMRSMLKKQISFLEKKILPHAKSQKYISNLLDIFKTIYEDLKEKQKNPEKINAEVVDGFIFQLKLELEVLEVEQPKDLNLKKLNSDFQCLFSKLETTKNVEKSDENSKDSVTENDLLTKLARLGLKKTESSNERIEKNRLDQVKKDYLKNRKVEEAVKKLEELCISYGKDLTNYYKEIKDKIDNPDFFIQKHNTEAAIRLVNRLKEGLEKENISPAEKIESFKKEIMIMSNCGITEKGRVEGNIKVLNEAYRGKSFLQKVKEFFGLVEKKMSTCAFFKAVTGAVRSLERCDQSCDKVEQTSQDFL